MIISRGLSELPPPAAAGAVVSVGVFDGIHLGHQAILSCNVTTAEEIGAVPTVVTFSSHPKETLIGRAPRTLTTLAHRLELFRRAGIQHCLVLAFDEELRQTSVDDFVEHTLVEGLGVKRFVLGFDSKFGRDREGTPEMLRSRGHAVTVVEKVVVNERAVSSTAIREAVELGDIEGASRRDQLPLSTRPRTPRR